MSLSLSYADRDGVDTPKKFLGDLKNTKRKQNSPAIVVNDGVVVARAIVLAVCCHRAPEIGPRTKRIGEHGRNNGSILLNQQLERIHIVNVSNRI